METKYSAITAVEEGIQSKTQIAREFGIPQTTLSTWIKSADKTKEALLHSGAKIHRIRQTKFADVDEAAMELLNIARDKKVLLNGPHILRKAEESATNLDHNDVHASNGSLNRSKERHAIVFKRDHGGVKSVVTVSNCFRHSGFTKAEEESAGDISDDDEDDIFLSSLCGPGVAMSVCSAVDDDVMTCAPPTDQDIVDYRLGKQKCFKVEDDLDDDPTADYRDDVVIPPSTDIVVPPSTK